MEFRPAFIAGAGADLRPSETGALLEYRVTSLPSPVKMELMPGKINGVSEKGALCEYRRTHVALDTCGAGFEFCSRIPFGAEYKMRRIMDMGAGWCTVSCDASVVGPGNIRSLELGDIILRGSWTECRIAFADGRVEKTSVGPDGVRFSSAVPWRAVELADMDGSRFEVGTGDDWWRWMWEEGSGSEYSLEIIDGTAALRRKIFDLPEADGDEEEQVRRKSWRCQWYWAWRSASETAEADAAVDMGIAPECCKTPGVQRALRNAVRKIGAGADTAGALRNGNLLCGNSAHLERPGRKELLHFDRCEALKTFLWANRRIAANGGSGFVWIPAESSGYEPFAAEIRMRHIPESGFSSPAREAGESE